MAARCESEARCKLVDALFIYFSILKVEVRHRPIVHLGVVKHMCLMHMFLLATCNIMAFSPVAYITYMQCRRLH